MFDLLIKGGHLVDGTGAAARSADVAVKDGLVAEVAPAIEAEAAETIDATDQLVTPGFVDIHTHYDGQATWDTSLDPSAGHGVTTLVMGNCGVGFAPVHPGPGGLADPAHGGRGGQPASEWPTRMSPALSVPLSSSHTRSA